MMIGERAVVLGGSVAGLCAARALSEAFEEVIVIERDPVSRVNDPRRGVPQARHTHVLISRGQQALEELFPGLIADVAAEGAPTLDHLGDVRWILSGHRLARTRSGLPVVSASRPLLERRIRDRVGALPGVTVLGGHDAAGVTTTRDGRGITGARVLARTDGSSEQVLAAELVIDATGRGSRASAWLAELGRTPPRLETVPIDVSYTTAVMRASTLRLDGDLGLVQAPFPGHPRGGAVQLVESDRALVTLAGVLGQRPGPGRDGMVAFAGALAEPDLREVMEGATWLSDPETYRFRASTRRRFEELHDLPDGFLVMGDALCSFNPLYAQGMTVAAIEALILMRHLAQGTLPRSADVMRDLAAAVDVPWSMAVGGDLAFPEVPGRRSIGTLVGNAYLPRLHAAARHDPSLSISFMRVAGLLDPPSALMRPAVALRVLRSSGPAGSQPLVAEDDPRVDV